MYNTFSIIFSVKPWRFKRNYASCIKRFMYWGFSFCQNNFSIIFGAEKVFGFDISSIIWKAKYTQIPLASIIGALPECGSAVVGAAYSSGSVSIGAVVRTLIAILVNFIPGYGLQTLVKLFNINGLIALAVLISNSVANYRGLLFPVIVLNPKIAFIAIIYSTIPAFIVVCTFYFLAPNYLAP